MSIGGRTTRGTGQNLRRVRRCRLCSRKFWGRTQGRWGRGTEAQETARNLCPDCFFKTYQKHLPSFMRLLTPDEEVKLKNYYQAQGCVVRQEAPVGSPKAP